MFGLRYTSASEIKTYSQLSGIRNLNEIFNETEALEMANVKECQGRFNLDDGSFFRVRNFESSNYRITNYGELIKILLGDEATFKGMYISPNEMFELFNRRYGDVFSKNFNNNKDAFENLIIQIEKLKKTRSKEDHLMLQKVLTQCLEKKMEKQLGKKDTGILKSELEKFSSFSMSNDNEQIRESMEHIRILNSLGEKIKEQEKSERAEKKRKWIRGFIENYDIAETSDEYERRTYDEEKNMREVVQALDLGMFNRKEIVPELIKSDGDENSIEIYSIKQITAMVRLLKAADNLTIEGGRDYLEEFSNIPFIEKTLLAMKKGGYTKELEERAQSNKDHNTIPNYNKTMAESDKEFAQEYLKSGDLFKDSVEEELKYRENQLRENQGSNIVIGKDSEMMFPKKPTMIGSLMSIISQQQGGRPGNAHEENHVWNFVCNKPKEIQLEGMMKIIHDSLREDVIKSGITKSEIDGVVQETKQMAMNKDKSSELSK